MAFSSYVINMATVNFILNIFTIIFVKCIQWQKFLSDVCILVVQRFLHMNSN